jgi:hypothetical protein
VLANVREVVDVVDFFECEISRMVFGKVVVGE